MNWDAFYDIAMAHRTETRRQWISGLGIILTALICLFAFSKLAPALTFVVALTAFFALIFFFWLAGKQKDH